MVLQKLSRRKLRGLQLASMLICFLILLWVVFSPISGWLRSVRVNRELAELQAENETLQKQNKNLKEEINKLTKDPEYLEGIARDRFGMLKKNEVIYQFDSKK